MQKVLNNDSFQILTFDKNRFYERFRKKRFYYISIIALRFKKRGIFQLLNDLFNLMASLFYLKSIYISNKPSYAQIEPTTRCNLRCRMCISLNNNIPPMDLSIEDFKRIIAKLPSIICLNLQGNGEPLLNEGLFEMISYASDKGIATFTCTNATLLSDSAIEKILLCGLFEIAISIESINKKTYEYIRDGSDFDNVMSNISKLIKMRNKLNPKMIIKLWVTIMEENIGEVTKVIDFAKELGVDGICFQQIQTKYDYKKNYSANFKDGNNSSFRLRKKLFYKKFGKYINKAGIMASYINKCHWPWLGMFINPKGDVVPCCVIHDYQKYRAGNIFEEELSEIWNKKIYRNLRESLISGNAVTDCCDGCTFKA